MDIRCIFKGLFPKRVFAAGVENIKLQIDIEIPFMRVSIFDKAPQGSKHFASLALSLSRYLLLRARVFDFDKKEAESVAR